MWKFFRISKGISLALGSILRGAMGGARGMWERMAMPGGLAWGGQVTKGEKGRLCGSRGLLGKVG